MQLDDKYLDAVGYIKAQLLSLQLANPQWLEQVNAQTNVSGTTDYIRVVVEQFPDRDGILKRFSVEKLRATLEDMLIGGTSDVRISTGELEVAARQQQVLLDLQRYLSRRKRSRVLRLVNAAHRRAILGHPQGPINQQLSLAVEDLITNSR